MSTSGWQAGVDESSRGIPLCANRNKVDTLYHLLWVKKVVHVFVTAVQKAQTRQSFGQPAFCWTTGVLVKPADIQEIDLLCLCRCWVFTNMPYHNMKDSNDMDVPICLPCIWIILMCKDHDFCMPVQVYWVLPTSEVICCVILVEHLVLPDVLGHELQVNWWMFFTCEAKLVTIIYLSKQSG